jgi:hypothetical protein
VILTTAASRLHSAIGRRIIPASGVRRHLAPGLDLEIFFERLKQRDVRYVVLRWFDTLPFVGEEEDIDLLVADEDLDYVRSLLATRRSVRTTQKFDIYSVSGLPG